VVSDYEDGEFDAGTCLTGYISMLPGMHESKMDEICAWLAFIGGFMVSDTFSSDLSDVLADLGFVLASGVFMIHLFFVIPVIASVPVGSRSA